MKSERLNTSSCYFVGYKICKVPCVSVDYRIAMEKYDLRSDELSSFAGGANGGICWIQLSRLVQFEVVNKFYFSVKNKIYIAML